MIRFILVFVLAFCVALLITVYTKSLAAPIFEELLSAFIVLTLITGTLSYALYAYVDNVTKDVASDARARKHERYISAIEKLTDLKKEILVNAFAVVGLLILERVAHGFSLIFPTSTEQPFNWLWAFAISIRVACFASSVVIAAIQFRGFIHANEFRSAISRNS